jgi:hypothetical protein
VEVVEAGGEWGGAVEVEDCGGREKGGHQEEVAHCCCSWIRPRSGDQREQSRSSVGARELVSCGWTCIVCWGSGCGFAGILI